MGLDLKNLLQEGTFSTSAEDLNTARAVLLANTSHNKASLVTNNNLRILDALFVALFSKLI